MNDDRKYVKLFCDMLTKGKRLKDAEFGRLIRAALEYRQSGVEPELTGNEAFLWDGLKMDIDRASEAYEKTVRANRENGMKGGRPPKPSETQDNPKNPMGFPETQITHLPQEQRTKNKEQRTKSKDYTEDVPPVSPPGKAFTYSDEFERFWAAYPKKASKGDAYKAFNRITGVPLSVMLYAIDEQRHSRMWTEDNGRYIPNPATWLNRRDWENGPTETEPQGGGSFANMEVDGDDKI